MLKLSAALLLAALSAVPVLQSETIWREAVEAHGRGDTYGPGHTVILIQELDAEGAVVSYERGETRTDWRGAEPEVTLIAAEKNGKDASAEWKKRLARQDGEAGGPPEGFDASPLMARYSEAVRLGQSAEREGGVGLPYTLKAEKTEAAGTMRFGADGRLLSLEQRWTKLPLLLSSMSAAYSYEYYGDALVIRAVVMEAEATILFVKKRLRMEFSFSEWQKKP